MLAKMIDKIVSLKETKIFEIDGQTYADASLTRIPPHVDRPDCISVSGLDSICKLIRTELEKVGTTIMVQVKSNDTVEVMTTYLSDFSRNTLYRAKADAPGLRTGFRGREVALIELRSLCISIKVTYKSEGLQKLRKAAGLSQSQLADLAGIKVQVLQQYERGARDINGAKLPTLLKICNALECRLADIITDEETLELLKKYEEH